MGVIENKIAIKKLSKAGSKGSYVVYADSAALQPGAEGVYVHQVEGLGVLISVSSAGDIPTYLYHDKELTTPVTREEFAENRNNLYIDTYLGIEGLQLYSHFVSLSDSVNFENGSLISIGYGIIVFTLETA